MSADVDISPDQIDRVFEGAVFETSWRCYQAGERYLLGGGVSTRTIADRLDAGCHRVWRTLSRLERDGVVVELHGATPTDLRARTNWAPVAIYDGGAADE